MLTIHAVDPREVEVALNVQIDMPAVAFVGVDDNEIAGTGGLAWGGGRCWLWFHTVQQKREYVGPILRQAKLLMRKAAQLGETEVYTVRDTAFDTSPRLMKLCGFEFFAVESGQEVFVCRFCR